MIVCFVSMFDLSAIQYSNGGASVNPESKTPGNAKRNVAGGGKGRTEGQTVRQGVSKTWAGV